MASDRGSGATDLRASVSDRLQEKIMLSDWITVEELAYAFIIGSEVGIIVALIKEVIDNG